MKSNFSVIALLLFFNTGIFAQTYEYKNVGRFSAKSRGVILQDEAIKGYYVFYPLEKVEKKTMAFKISLLDDNLVEVADFQIVRPKHYSLVESSFNNSVFVFSFYNAKTKGMEHVTIDRSGKEMGSIMGEKLTAWEKFVVQQGLDNFDKVYSTIFPIGNTGFLRNSTADNKQDGYRLGLYDNTLKQQWAYESDPNSEMFETAEVLSSDENYILAQITKRKNIRTSKFDTYLLLLDAKTGKEFYNFQMQDDNEAQLSVLNAFVRDDEGEVLTIGEFYAPGDNVVKDKSLGIFTRGIDKNGEYSFFKKYNWDGEIAKARRNNATEEDNKKGKDKDLIFFHNVIRTANGHVFAIAEQYRKQMSAAGTVFMIAGGGNNNTAASEIRVTDMVVAEFDNDLNLLEYSIIPKKLYRVLLPQGFSLYSPQKLGYYVDAISGFNYYFTSVNKEDDTYHVLYADYNRKEEDSKEKSDAMVGSINIDKGEVKTERFPINTEANDLWLSRAKPGYIMIGEYFRKGRIVKLHLEKITI